MLCQVIYIDNRCSFPSIRRESYSIILKSKTRHVPVPFDLLPSHRTRPLSGLCLIQQFASSRQAIDFFNFKRVGSFVYNVSVGGVFLPVSEVGLLGIPKKINRSI